MRYCYTRASWVDTCMPLLHTLLLANIILGVEKYYLHNCDYHTLFHLTGFVFAEIMLHRNIE